MPYLAGMRLRVADLLAERGMTAYQLAKASGDRLSLSTCYRLARGEADSISTSTVEALCDVLGIKDPGPLFEREGRTPRRRST
jgi:DNA-binding Xre family transcriptional regulator